MTRVRWWLAATRPKTLVLSAFPTAAGIAWAAGEGSFDPARAVLTLVCAVLLQILANYVNELGDYERGADTPERLGPPRAVAAGAISPRAMRRAVIVLSAVILALGLVLVARVGWWLLVVGVSALALAWLYTSGWRPLAYIGLGEAVALVFFGPVPSLGAYAIERSTVAAEPLASGIAFGALAAAVLGINNLRDIPLDRRAGKRTLAVRIGRRNATRLVQALLAVPYLVAAFQSIEHPAISSTLVTLPIAWSVAMELPRAEGRAYNRLLARTTLATAAYGSVLIVAILV
jgi:1,4-dihydroxy-2-naphthoate octaprenyltransferase